MKRHPGRMLALGLAAATLAAAAPAAAETFTYDALGRLVSGQSDSGATRTFVYDAADNIVQIVIS